MIDNLLYFLMPFASMASLVFVAVFIAQLLTRKRIKRFASAQTLNEINSAERALEFRLYAARLVLKRAIDNDAKASLAYCIESASEVLSNVRLLDSPSQLMWEYHRLESVMYACVLPFDSEENSKETNSLYV